MPPLIITLLCWKKRALISCLARQHSQANSLGSWREKNRAVSTKKSMSHINVKVWISKFNLRSYPNMSTTCQRVVQVSASTRISARSLGVLGWFLRLWTFKSNLFSKVRWFGWTKVYSLSRKYRAHLDILVLALTYSTPAQVVLKTAQKITLRFSTTRCSGL